MKSWGSCASRSLYSFSLCWRSISNFLRLCSAGLTRVRRASFFFGSLWMVISSRSSFHTVTSLVAVSGVVSRNSNSNFFDLFFIWTSTRILGGESMDFTDSSEFSGNTKPSRSLLGSLSCMRLFVSTKSPVSFFLFAFATSRTYSPGFNCIHPGPSVRARRNISESLEGFDIAMVMAEHMWLKRVRPSFSSKSNPTNAARRYSPPGANVFFSPSNTDRNSIIASFFVFSKVSPATHATRFSSSFSVQSPVRPGSTASKSRFNASIWDLPLHTRAGYVDFSLLLTFFSVPKGRLWVSGPVPKALLR
mmetsp:Transcript_11694/g.23020  ORF Transcript_11694/g.23020 Transcript_11694/m.23020 type:complete len:305 (+) Transcript_11694:474-1388(+)